MQASERLVKKGIKRDWLTFVSGIFSSCFPLFLSTLDNIFTLQKWYLRFTFNLDFQYEVLYLEHQKEQKPTELIRDEPGE